MEMHSILSWIFIFIIPVIIKGDDVCSGSFSAFLQCLVDDAEKKLGSNVQELAPEVKHGVQECFVTNGCEKPDFSQATLPYFLNEPWLTRASDILDLLDNMDPKVKLCMMRYLLDVVRNKINNCVNESGNVGDFEMPPLPDIHNIDVSKLKEVVLNRMMIRKYVQKCNESRGEQVENTSMECIGKARSQNDQTMCITRTNCRAQKITSDCMDRFDKVRSAVCACVNRKGTGMGIAGELLLSGRLEKNFKKCHDDNNVTYPTDKVKKARDAIAQSASDLMTNHQKWPPEVKQTLVLARQSMSDIEGQWKGTFCGDCSSGNSAAFSSDSGRR